MKGSRFLLDSLINLTDMKEQALDERKLERAEIIDEIIADRLNELAALFMRGGE